MERIVKSNMWCAVCESDEWTIEDNGFPKCARYLLHRNIDKKVNTDESFSDLGNASKFANTFLDDQLELELV